MAVPIPKVNPNGTTKAAQHGFNIAVSQKLQDIMEKLDADAGITDTNYESLHTFAAGDIQIGTTTAGRGLIL